VGFLEPFFMNVRKIRLLYEKTEYKKEKIACARDVFEFCRKIELQNEIKEHLLGIFLDSKNRIAAYSMLSIGTLNQTVIHPRDVFGPALYLNANSLILAHNHPSGDPTPSRDDKEITKQISNGGKLLEIDLLDHIIIGDLDYYSFKENGTF